MRDAETRRHHCHSPHRGLLEMYRVARRGVLAFEPRDTRLVRLGVRLGFGQEYEIAAVAGKNAPTDHSKRRNLKRMTAYER